MRLATEVDRRWRNSLFVSGPCVASPGALFRCSVAPPRPVWRKAAGKSWREPFKGKALAESFRADLLSAARRGEAFDMETGQPVSMHRATREMTCYRFACAFVDMKWPRVAATTRRTHAEALTAVTAAADQRSGASRTTS